MPQATAKLQTPFEVLLASIRDLALEEKRTLWKLLDKQISQVEKNGWEQTPRVQAQVREARAAYQTGEHVTVDVLIGAAQQLPLRDQVELAQALRTVLHSKRPDTIEAELRPLDGMEEAELRVLADIVLAPDCQQELSDLLHKNHEEKLTKDEERRLNTLLAETDQVALLKARALYTLNLYQTAGKTNK